MKTRYQITKEVEKEAKKDLVKQFTGVLSALLPVLTILGISLEWFNEEFINHLYLFLAALVPFAYNVYAIIKNHYSGEKARREKEVLKEQGLK